MKPQIPYNYMILRVAYRMQPERGLRVDRTGPMTDPNAKLIGDSTSYSGFELEVNENLAWKYRRLSLNL
jgi:hypothetical protein